MEKDLHIHIRAIGAYVPPRTVTNDDLSAVVDTNDEWILSHTGIGSRHIADEGVATSDLACLAIGNLFIKSGLDPQSVDAIVLATATQDFLGFPSTACVVQHKLGLSSIPAFDISAGCTGFIYALEIAKGLLNNGTLRNILVVGAEKLSSVTDWTDRNTCVLFGDGAGCVLVGTEGPADSQAHLVDSVLHADGSGAMYLCIPEGGSSVPSRSDSLPSSLKLHMDGRLVYGFAVRVMGEVIGELLSRNGLDMADIDWIVPHQANIRIIQAAAKRMGIAQEKFFTNIESYANTSSASIPIALSQMVDLGLLRPGQLVMTVGFGAGLTYGGNLIRW
ncbi:MAG: beta-ketoacyl-ACP synthase III [Sphaerochaetaceae bacterium]